LPAETLLTLVRDQLEDDKAGDIVVIDLSGKSSIADYMVIASGQSTRQVGAMTDHLLEMFRKNGLRGAKVEGRSRSDWVLVDSGDIVIHLFRPEVREFYKLEKLWSHDLPEMAEASTAVQTA
jgi:ribosome-associated protein|tara:strand:- start:85 stop:450 length:366 start_codon:yes stop_codon:yes gene_type:complete